jgi:hypothetical protein
MSLQRTMTPQFDFETLHKKTQISDRCKGFSCIPISRPTDAICDRFLFSIYMCITLHVSRVRRSSSGVPHRTYILQFLCLCLSATLSCKKTPFFFFLLFSICVKLYMFRASSAHHQESLTVHIDSSFCVCVCLRHCLVRKLHFSFFLLFSIYMCITLHVSSVKRSSSGVPHHTYSLLFLCLCLSAALSCKKLSETQKLEAVCTVRDS